MYFVNKKIAITGMGFLGTAVYQKLKDLGAEITVIDGDVRFPDSLKDIDYSYDYFFHFGSPSSQVQFKQNPRYCIDATINGFLNISNVCKYNGIKLIYPSTGLLSQGKTNEYATCKKICEDIHESEKLDAIGLRIFATYGPGEDHKRDYASVPFLFARDMLNGIRPVIFGDGKQTRDFVYIDDVVSEIIRHADVSNSGIYDIGSATKTSFNELLDILYGLIPRAPHHINIDKPGNYVEETCARTPLIGLTPLKVGLKQMVNKIKENI